MIPPSDASLSFDASNLLDLVAAEVALILLVVQASPRSPMLFHRAPL
jgi:hypothetical protein